MRFDRVTALPDMKGPTDKKKTTVFHPSKGHNGYVKQREARIGEDKMPRSFGGAHP